MIDIIVTHTALGFTLSLIMFVIGQGPRTLTDIVDILTGCEKR